MLSKLYMTVPYQLHLHKHAPNILLHNYNYTVYLTGDHAYSMHGIIILNVL